MGEIHLPPAEAARLLGIPESEVSELVRPDGRVALETVREHLGTTALELARELARAREEVGYLSGDSPRRSAR